MAIQIQEKNDVVVFSIEGKLMGGSESIELKNALQDCIDKGFQKVVIDFAKLKWANSAGIGIIISCYLTMRRLNGDLRTARVTDRVDYYFRISKLNTIIKIYDTVEEAVESFQNI